jgi:uncharacterized protein (TIGR02466 family)
MTDEIEIPADIDAEAQKIVEEGSDPIGENQDKPKELGRHLENVGIMPLFPTALVIGEVNDEQMLDELTEACYKLREDKQGMEEAGNFTSHDQIHTPELGFEKLHELVLNECHNFAQWQTLKYEELYVTTMWCNITNPNHRHPVHLHPNSLFSGIIYLKTPDKCGGTAFVDPRPAARVFEPNYEKMNEFNSGRFTFPAERGKMLIWPSWMSHGVERGFTEDETEDRIVIAFNVMMTGKIDTMTAKLELN